MFCFLNTIVLATDCKYKLEIAKQEQQKCNRQLPDSLHYFKTIKLKQFWQDTYATSLWFSLQLCCRGKLT